MSVKWVEMVMKSYRNAFPLPLQPCDSWMFVKENAAEYKLYKRFTNSNHDMIFLKHPLEIKGFVIARTCLNSTEKCPFSASKYRPFLIQLRHHKRNQIHKKLLMRSQETAYLFTLTEKILDWKLHFLCAARFLQMR